MELLEGLKTRRSVRQYDTTKKIPHEDIEKMLEEYSDRIFSIEDWNKESMQKFFIEKLSKGDFEHA